MAHRVEGEASWLTRCKLCQVDIGGGEWAYDGNRVMEAALRYIDDWFAGNVPDEVETKQREIERIRQEREAERGGARSTWKHG